MWHFASGKVGSGENFAGDVWNSRWRESVIDSGTEMGDIAEAVYEELKRSDPMHKMKRRK